MHRQLRAQGMCARPCQARANDAARSTATGRAAARSSRRAMARRPRGETFAERRRRLPSGSSGATAKIDAKTRRRRGRRSARAGFRRAFVPSSMQVVGPFEHERLAGRGDVNALRSAPARRPAKASAPADRRAPISTSVLPKKLPVRGNPAPSLPSPARILLERDQPVAFDGGFVGNQVGIGRAGALDDRGCGVRRATPRRGR